MLLRSWVLPGASVVSVDDDDDLALGQEGQIGVRITQLVSVSVADHQVNMAIIIHVCCNYLNAEFSVLIGVGWLEQRFVDRS